MKGGTKIKNINKILIQRLRKYNFQNFSQLLNTPEPEITYFSYFESIANLIYESVYDDKANLETEINKDLDKFPEGCISIEDSSNNIKYKTINDPQETEPESLDPNNNIKILLDEPIEVYINKIESKYNRFSSNHKEMSKRNNKTDDGFDRSQRFLNLKAIYTSSGPLNVPLALVIILIHIL